MASEGSNNAAPAEPVMPDLGAMMSAAQAGVNVTLLDENERPGGQVFRQFEKGFKVADPDALVPDFKEGQELLHQFN